MKTVLHTIDTTGPGGAETVFIDLAANLSAEKYRPVVVIRGKGWVYDELWNRGINPILLDGKGSFNWRYLLKLINIIQTEKVDLIQSHLLGASVYCSIAGLFTATPVVATFHGTVDIGKFERKKWLKMAAINTGANNIITVSNGLYDDITSRTMLKKKKIKIIYNGIDTKKYQNIRSRTFRKEFGWTEEEFVIGSLGNVRSAKGYDILLHAAKILKEKGLSPRFAIAGQPDKRGLYDNLLGVRKKLGLEKSVEFLGYLKEPANFLSSVDLFLSSSITEGMPLAAIQAMATGLPILATRCGGYEELIANHENGWLVDVGNPLKLANAIEFLMNNPELRESLGNRAQRRAVEAFDINVMRASYERVYDDLLCGT